MVCCESETQRHKSCWTFRYISERGSTVLQTRDSRTMRLGSHPTRSSFRPLTLRSRAASTMSLRASATSALHRPPTRSIRACFSTSAGLSAASPDKSKYILKSDGAAFPKGYKAAVRKKGRLRSARLSPLTNMRSCSGHPLRHQEGRRSP